MALSAGTRLGPYEIITALGAGGMGEVYRARDTKLNRDVAVKILPAAFAADGDRLARFMREARTLASLNHTHIAQVHGLEDSGGVHALVMELVEGEELSATKRGPVPVAEAVEIAKQVAEALEAAHEQGIVHRDLKPANIKIRPDGTVKVLDFGLAKVWAGEAGAAAADPSLSPTLTSQGTVAGIILGTAAYMAPEQARGVAVDKRADIWAFGVVLFELVSGQRLFEGETVSDTLAAVLRQEIDWKRLPAATPDQVVQLLRRCLEREPKRRLRDVGEARITLEQLAASPTSSAALSLPAPAAIAARRSPRMLLPAVAIGAAALIAGAVIALQVRPSIDAPTLRLTTLLPADITIDPSTYPILAMSHDGSTIAFAGVNNGTSRLYVRRLAEFDARPLRETEGATAPFFSPDDAWIGFFGDGKLKKTPTAGGPVVTLAPGSDVRGGVWTSGDTIVFSPDATTPLHEISGSGGSSRAVTTLDQTKQERTHRWPVLMPDQKTVLFNVGTVAHPNDYDDAAIEAVNLETGKRQLVLQGGRMPKYVAGTGDLLYMRGKILYAVAMDPKTLQLRGKPRPVLDGVMGDPTTGSAFYGVSDAGTLVYAPGDPSGALRRFTWTDLEGKASPIDLPAALYLDPRVSPDGRRIAFAIVDATSSDADIWIADPVRGTSSRLTSHGVYRSPVWSRDGRRLFYTSYDPKNNRATIEVRGADGSGHAETIGAIDGPTFIDDISLDGSTLYLDASPPTGAAGRACIYVLPTTGRPDSKPTPFLATPAADIAVSAVSPDGRWLAFVSDESGRYEIFVQSLRDGSGRMQVSTNGGQNPRWAPDGRAIYYLQGADALAVSVETSSGLAAGKPRRLFGHQLALSFDSQQYFAVAPDGRLLMMRPNDDRPPTPELRVILNWFRELKTQVPTR